MPDKTPTRAITGWTVALWSFTAVAGGVIVGGLLHEPEPELTTAPPTTTVSVTPEAEPPTPVRVRPSVTFPTQIPGCSSVEAPSFDETYGAVFGPGEYDNPAYPWFSGRKAVAMSTALRAALPTDVTLEFGPPDRSLLFTPILGEPDSPFGGYTDAWADLRRGAGAGTLSVTVEQSAEPVPACTAGWLDERRTMPDGSTVDLHDTWEELDGFRTLSRSVMAYRPDGSRIVVRSTDAPSVSMPTGTVPLTRDEMIAIALADGLGVGDPIPPGTIEPPPPCHVRVDDSPTLGEAVAARVNAALAGALDGVSTDRPLGDVRPDDFGMGLCQAIRVTTPGQPSTLTVSIAAGQPMPNTQPKYGGSARTSADGTLIETREEYLTTADQSGRTAEEFMRTVVLTKPDGTRIDVTCRAEMPSSPMPFEQLEKIALAPGSVTP